MPKYLGGRRGLGGPSRCGLECLAFGLLNDQDMEAILNAPDEARWRRASNCLRGLLALALGRLEQLQIVRNLARHNAVACLDALHFQMLEIGTVLHR